MHAGDGCLGIDVQEEQHGRVNPRRQTGAGLDVDITRWFSVFAEYRVSYAEIDANLVGGGTLKTEPWTHHFALSVTFNILD